MSSLKATVLAWCAFLKVFESGEAEDKNTGAKPGVKLWLCPAYLCDKLPNHPPHVSGSLAVNGDDDNRSTDLGVSLMTQRSCYARELEQH